MENKKDRKTRNIWFKFFIERSYLDRRWCDDGLQNFIIFQAIFKIFTMPTSFTIVELVLQIQSLNGNLKDCQMKKSIPLIQQIIVFPQNWDGWIIQKGKKNLK